MVMTRDQLDKIAWQTIHDKPVIPLSEDTGRRARNYRELEAKLQAGIEFEHAFSDFLHGFYDHKDAAYFEFPSPASLSIERQAMLAGVAEWLSQEFGLPHPAWTDDSRFFLDQPWDPWSEVGDMSEFTQERLARAPEAFRKRNLAYLSRYLITL